MNTSQPQSYAQSRSFQHSGALQVLQQYMRWEEGDTVMDVGCGTGEICKYISQQPGVASVTGFDPSPDFVNYASEHNSAPNVLYHVADASDVSTIKPEWKGAFSKIVSMFVLHWIEEKASALKVLHSCLKSGGELLLLCEPDDGKISQVFFGMPSRPKWRMYLKDFVPSSALINEEQTSRHLEDCGFEVLTCHNKYFEYCYGGREQLRKFLRATFPHLRYIPQDKHGEFLNDAEQMAEDIHWISGGDVPTGNTNLLVVHARKL